MILAKDEHETLAVKRLPRDRRRTAEGSQGDGPENKCFMALHGCFVHSVDFQQD